MVWSSASADADLARVNRCGSADKLDDLFQ